MGNIATQAAPFSGTPRLPVNQYVQAAIDAGSPGDTYNLLVGEHIGQNVVLQAGDTLILNTGAVLNGAENIDGGWTVDSTEWKKTVQADDITSSSETSVRPGYDANASEWVIIDGIPRSWVTTRGAVDEFSAWYNGTEIFIGTDPAGKTVEIARAQRVQGDGANCTLRGESPDERGVIRGYACGDNTSGANGDTGVWMKGDNALLRDLEIFAMSGDGLALWDLAEAYNVTVHHCGHLCICVDNDPGSYPAGVIIGEGCWIYNGGIAGYESGDEGGNSKFFGSIDLVIKGSLWDYGDHPHKSGQGPLWLDINDDGYLIYANVVRDLDHGGKRGMFIETCYSGKIYNNICYELGWQAEGGGYWSNGIIISSAGPDLANSKYPTIEIYGNLLYNCSGGINPVGGRDTSVEPWHRWGFPYIHDLDIHNNTTVFDGTFVAFTETVGIEVDVQFGAVENIDYAANVYFVATAENRFKDLSVGGAGGDISWATWTGSGNLQDDDADAQHLVASGYDPNPFNGGAM
jgi:hypothetical protein